MKFSFYSKKNSWSRVSLLISTFIVLVSFFRTAKADSASARKACSRRQTEWGQRKEKQAEKKSWGQGETAKKPSSRPSHPIPFFFPFFSLLCFAPLWNRLASGLTARSKKTKWFLSCYATNTKSCRDSRSSLKNFRELRCHTMTISATRIFSAMHWHYNILLWVSNGCNIVPTFQHRVARKIVLANRLV